MDDLASPILMIDEFRSGGIPFGPHPHARYSLLNYVFEDSEGGLRSRDSLGNDLRVGPGGIVWTQAASGLIHEERPAEPGLELHGLQIFVNLRAENKLAAPCVFRLNRDQIPVWNSGLGDRVRVVVGSYGDAVSPLVPSEPIDLLDVDLKSECSFSLHKDHLALVLVLTGEIVVQAGKAGQKLQSGEALAIHGGPGCVNLASKNPAHLVLLACAEFREPDPDR
jgi:hypothetical protein